MFVARCSVEGAKPPVKGYIHEAGLREVYGTSDPVMPAGDYLADALKGHQGRMDEYAFLIAIAWGKVDGKSRERVVDCFAFDDFDGKNPGIYNWNLREGMWVTADRMGFCAHVLELVHAEKRLMADHDRLAAFIEDQTALEKLPTDLRASPVRNLELKL